MVSRVRAVGRKGGAGRTRWTPRRNYYSAPQVVSLISDEVVAVGVRDAVVAPVDGHPVRTASIVAAIDRVIAAARC